MSEQLLELSQISKYYGAKLILDQVSLAINHGLRMGLVGENGAGKTTLARIIIGTLEPDSGTKRLKHDLDIGYLPQEATLEEDVSVQRYLEQAMGDLDHLAAKLQALETEMADAHIAPVRLAALLEDYGQLQEDFTRRGGYDSDFRLDQIFAGLDLSYIDRQRPLHTLSGGEKTRVMLAGLLLGTPGLLILDEPTNHLDFKAVAWLEDYLLGYPGAVLVISHDRRLLNRAVQQIVALSSVDHKATVYHGNYDYYVAEREKQRLQQIEAYEMQQEEIKTLQRLIKAKTHSTGSGKPPRDGDKMAYDHKGGNVEKGQSREIQNARRRLEKLNEDRLTRPVQGWHINPDFAPEHFASQAAVGLIDVSKAFGDRVLVSCVNATISAGDRVVLVGPNGSGKTTLLKLILGLEAPDRGEIKIAASARLGYLDQEQESLDLNQTVLEAYRIGLTGPEEEHRANLHKHGLFTETQVHQPIGSLSIGQRRKLQIARLIASKANVLLLDEPTNHLDLDSIEQFERALCEFRGTVLATSHDRTFIERVATITWTFEQGQLLSSAR